MLFPKRRKELPMASKKQIDANRENAKHSTGPKSAATKARSRLNALRDGLTGQITTLSDADRAIFDKHKAELIAGFNPQTPMESKLALAIAWDTWRLDRNRAVEINMYAQGLADSIENGDCPEEPDDFDIALSHAATFRAQAKRFELMSLYETRMNRTMHRNLAILRDLQAERRRNYDHDKKEEVVIARLHEYNRMPIQTSAYPSKNGFYFSNEEIAIAAVRQRYVDIATCSMKHNFAGNLAGGLDTGHGDEFLRKIGQKWPLSPEERQEIYKTPPEVLAIQRLNNPEEFGLRLKDLE
jgi:hypothetical protein